MCNYPAPATLVIGHYHNPWQQRQPGLKASGSMKAGKLVERHLSEIREDPWNDKCCSNGFLPRGGGVENAVQMVWGSYLVNINHY